MGRVTGSFTYTPSDPLMAPPASTGGARPLQAPSPRFSANDSRYLTDNYPDRPLHRPVMFNLVPGA
ncbi:hypothetical protein DSCOOX_43200 [Desulfosarcina ovata subsp. ovata]|uniref:Uncharacterized protein n=1 Tax=Desulfosarcina ovata subsp. ovata TaxID=2752305 RepID=A0A5K8AH02_9BACT|nr:hypothetical protein DSCOOX_43200 [Desulfosarcina ovata subsp. ovata]